MCKLSFFLIFFISVQNNLASPRGSHVSYLLVLWQQFILSVQLNTPRSGASVCSVNAVKAKQFRQKSEHIDAGPVRSILLVFISRLWTRSWRCCFALFHEVFQLVMRSEIYDPVSKIYTTSQCQDWRKKRMVLVCIWKVLCFLFTAVFNRSLLLSEELYNVMLLVSASWFVFFNQTQTVCDPPWLSRVFPLRDVNSHRLTGELHACLNARFPKKKKKMIDFCQEKHLMSWELETITYVVLPGQCLWSGNKDK